MITYAHTLEVILNYELYMHLKGTAHNSVDNDSYLKWRTALYNIYQKKLVLTSSKKKTKGENETRTVEKNTNYFLQSKQIMCHVAVGIDSCLPFFYNLLPDYVLHIVWCLITCKRLSVLPVSSLNKQNQLCVSPNLQPLLCNITISKVT